MPDRPTNSRPWNPLKAYLRALWCSARLHPFEHVISLPDARYEVCACGHRDRTQVWR